MSPYLLSTLQSRKILHDKPVLFNLSENEKELIRLALEKFRGNISLTAKELGIKTIFVTSGKYKTADEIIPSLSEELKPDYIYGDMQEILEKSTLEII